MYICEEDAYCFSWSKVKVIVLLNVSKTSARTINRGIL
jgi:hypothetical protein